MSLNNVSVSATGNMGEPMGMFCVSTLGLKSIIIDIISNLRNPYFTFRTEDMKIIGKGKEEYRSCYGILTALAVQARYFQCSIAILF